MILPKDELLVVMKELYEEHGSQPAKIADALNQRGIQNTKGGAWTRNSVGRYVTRNLRDRYQPPTVTLPTLDMEVLNRLIELEKTGKMQELMDWYETTKDIPTAPILPDQRPLFRAGEVRNTGIAIAGEILDRAREQMKTEKHRVGKSLSQLIEFLLWQYVGSPTDLIEGVGAEKEE